MRLHGAARKVDAALAAGCRRPYTRPMRTERKPPCQSARNTDPLSASKFDPVGGVGFGSDPTKWSYDGGGPDPNPGVSGSVLEAPEHVAGFHNVTMVGKASKQRRGHFGVTKDAWPFAEGEVGGDDDGGALVKLADEVEQELATSLCEGEIAQLVQDDEVEAVQVIGQAALFAAAGLDLETIDQIDDIVEPAPRAVAE